MRFAAVVSLLVVLGLPAAAQAAGVYVNPGSAACSDAASIATASHASTPWCSPAPAVRLARPGDVVHLAAGTYASQLRPATSGTPAQPIVYQADGAVTIAAPAGTVSVMLVGVHDVTLRGLTVRASAAQGVWIDSASDILLTGVTVTNSAGAGVQIKGGTAVTIAHARLVNNSRAGLVDMAQSLGTTLSSSTVSGNGKDGQPYTATASASTAREAA